MTTPETAAECIARLRALDGARTPGPWQWDVYHEIDDGDGNTVAYVPAEDGSRATLDGANDARFIVAASAEVGWLLRVADAALALTEVDDWAFDPMSRASDQRRGSSQMAALKAALDGEATE